MVSFDDFSFVPPVRRGIADAGYAAPTPVQAATLPHALAGTDVVGVAQTGTGKTAAFVLPILDFLVRDGAGPGPRALVVAPTRELAVQVEAAVRTYGRHTRIRSAAIYGGVGKGTQRDALARGADLVVATPGRLLDLLSERVLDLAHVDILVLDEADRMLDMGFLPDVKRIVAAVPRQRQTMLFSATMPPEIQRLAATILTRPETVAVGERRDPAATVAQRAVAVAEADKQALLEHVLATEAVDRAIVFSRTKYRADRITRKLVRAGVAAVAIHSNRSQGQRQRALDGFEAGTYRVLVATDIAARGIDIDGVSHVVNFDTPGQPEDYIHRIGRTGRAGATGEALTFVSPDEAPNLTAIERHTGQPVERADFDGFDTPALAAPAPSGRSRTPRREVGGAPSGRTSGGTSGRGGPGARRAKSDRRR